MKKKVYAVRNGRKTGLFMSWDDCKNKSTLTREPAIKVLPMPTKLGNG